MQTTKNQTSQTVTQIAQAVTKHTRAMEDDSNLRQFKAHLRTRNLVSKSLERLTDVIINESNETYELRKLLEKRMCQLAELEREVKSLGAKVAASMARDIKASENI